MTYCRRAWKVFRRNRDLGWRRNCSVMQTNHKPLIPLTILPLMSTCFSEHRRSKKPSLDISSIKL